MTPYWRSASGDVVVYHARFEDVLAAGVVPVREVALVHDDPPYGLAIDFNRGGNVGARRAGGKAIVRAFPPCTGDDEPHDPAPVLALARPTVLWGANHYAPRVPPSPSWLLWDKREEVTPDDGADGELAWSNLGGPVRIFRCLWRGTLRRSEVGTLHLHPTQKPVALCLWVYERAKLTPGSLVFVPHGGSGPDLPACRAAGLRLIWCDVEAWCCDTAIARLPDAPAEVLARAKAFQRRHVTAERAAEPAGPLFARPQP